MNPVELTLIALVALSIALQVILARTLGQLVQGGIGHLDNSLAKALQETIAEMPNHLQEMAAVIPEPINPMQAMIMQIIQDKMKPPSLEVKEISRSDDGKFS